MTKHVTEEQEIPVELCPESHGQGLGEEKWRVRCSLGVMVGSMEERKRE